MPTSRRRHQVTETPEVARAIDCASRHWPGMSRGQLIVRLVEAGAAALEGEDARERERRARLIAALGPKYAEFYPAGYLQEIRQDWPA